MFGELQQLPAVQCGGIVDVNRVTIGNFRVSDTILEEFRLVLIIFGIAIPTGS